MPRIRHSVRGRHGCDTCMSFMGNVDVTLVTYTLYLYVIHISLVMLNGNLYVFLFTKYSTQELFHILSVVEFIGEARGVLREVWYKVNMDLNREPTMRQHPVFNSPPQSQMILRDFDAPVNFRDYYVQRLTSYLQVFFDLPLNYAFRSAINEKWLVPWYLSRVVIFGYALAIYKLILLLGT